MSIRALFAAIAVVAVPIAVSGEEPSRPAREARTEKICQVSVAIGSRLKQVRRCRSAREWQEYRKEIDMDLTRQLAHKTVVGGP